MKNASLLFLVIAPIASMPVPAAAQTAASARPSPLPHPDQRVRQIPYVQDAIATVSARPGFETMISFALDERIQNVAVGDSSSWQVTPNKLSNLLFVKPVAMDAHTNMAVVTDRRTYLFELRADEGAGPLMYNLRFNYPDATPVPAAVTSAVIEVKIPWRATGALALRPARAYDDGRSVFLAWPQGDALPAVLAVDDKGNEEPLTFTARNNFLITDMVPAKIVVRVGAAQAVLTPQSARQRAAQIAGR